MLSREDLTRAVQEMVDNMRTRLGASLGGDENTPQRESGGARFKTTVETPGEDGYTIEFDAEVRMRRASSASSSTGLP